MMRQTINLVLGDDCSQPTERVCLVADDPDVEFHIVDDGLKWSDDHLSSVRWTHPPHVWIVGMCATEVKANE